MSDFQHSLRRALDPASSDPVAYRTRFAMRALIAGGRRTGRASAADHCTLLTLDIADFHGLAVNQPELSAAIRERAVGRVERS